MSITINERQESINQLIANAHKLRAAGVLSLNVNGMAVTLAPAPPAPLPIEHAEIVPEYADPLDDPATYAGGRVPKFTNDSDED